MMKKLLVVVLAISSIICTFNYIYQNLLQPLTEAEIKESIIIASNIGYSEQMNFCYDIPNGYYVKIDSGTIIVKPIGKKYGYVKCTFNSEKIEAKFYSENIAYISIIAFITFAINSAVFFLIFYKGCCKKESDNDLEKEKVC